MPNKMDIFKAIQSKIEQYNNIVIFIHVRPDGDCLGAQQGFKELININYPNKKVFAVGDSDNLFPFLNIVMDPIPADDILSSALGIVVDANFSDRIQNSELIMNKKIKEVIRIDHHPCTDDLNTSLEYVDSNYIAASEQVTDITQSLGWKFNPRAATFLFLGISTDSGRFSYTNTSPRTYHLGGFLIEQGIDVGDFYRKLYTRDLSDLNTFKVIYENTKAEGNVLYFVASQEFLKKNNLDKTISSHVNSLSNINNYYIWIFFVQEEDLTWRGRLRSSGPNVNAVASTFNGGGHNLASGLTVNNEEDIDKVLKRCHQEIDTWKSIN